MNRRELLVRTLATGALAASARPAVGSPEDPRQPAAPSPRPRAAGRKALFVYGGWEGHEPVQTRDLWLPWLERQGFEVTTSATLAPYADAALMKSLDVVVQSWTMGEIAKEQLDGLVGAVQDGAGIAGWHGGLSDAFRGEPAYQFMVCGQFVAHPGGVIEYGVSVVDPGDEVMAGLRDFRLRSEQYYMHVDPNNKVLATTRFGAEHAPWIAGATMPVVWKRVHGRGRVFFSALGHKASDFAVREIFEIAKRGVLWASESRHAPIPALVSPLYAARR